jgi:hypothetical protein
MKLVGAVDGPDPDIRQETGFPPDHLERSSRPKLPSLCVFALQKVPANGGVKRGR